VVDCTTAPLKSAIASVELPAIGLHVLFAPHFTAILLETGAPCDLSGDVRSRRFPPF